MNELENVQSDENFNAPISTLTATCFLDSTRKSRSLSVNSPLLTGIEISDSLTEDVNASCCFIEDSHFQEDDTTQTNTGFMDTYSVSETTEVMHIDDINNHTPLSGSEDDLESSTAYQGWEIHHPQSQDLSMLSILPENVKYRPMNDSAYVVRTCDSFVSVSVEQNDSSIISKDHTRLRELDFADECVDTKHTNDYECLLQRSENKQQNERSVLLFSREITESVDLSNSSYLVCNEDAVDLDCMVHTEKNRSENIISSLSLSDESTKFDAANNQQLPFVIKDALNFNSEAQSVASSSTKHSECGKGRVPNEENPDACNGNMQSSLIDSYDIQKEINDMCMHTSFDTHNKAIAMFGHNLPETAPFFHPSYCTSNHEILQKKAYNSSSQSDNNCPCVKSLHDLSLEINKKDASGVRPAHLCAQQGHVACLEMLVTVANNVNEMDSDGITPAHLAAQNGHVSCLELLKSCTENVNTTDNDGVTPCHLAAKNGHALCLQWLIRNCTEKSTCNINTATTDGFTPAHYAAQSGQTMCLKILIEFSADINKGNNDGLTPAHCAAANGHFLCLLLLANHSIDVCKPDYGGVSPLHCAAASGNEQCLQLLVEYSLDISLPDTVYGATPAHVAAETGHASCLELLLKKSADLNKADKCYGFTPLHLAARNGHLSCAQLLVDFSADIERTDNDGFTPSILAALHGHSLCLEMLVSNSAFTLDETYIPHAILAICNGHHSCLQVLLNIHPDIVTKKHGKSTLGHLAICEDQVSCLNVLIQHSPALIRKVVVMAVSKGRADCLQVLLSHSPETVCRALSNGLTLLHIAAEGQESCLQVLMNYRADVNKIDNTGNTPLHIASQCGAVGCVKLLIKNGASVNIRNKSWLGFLGGKGFLPFEVAKDNATRAIFNDFM